jgi:hypothetical protein
MLPAATAFAVLTLGACGDPTASDALYDEAAVTLDVAASAGDAVATMLVMMAGNEAFAGGDAELAATAAPSTTVGVSRSRSCYDAAGAPVTNCMPFSSVRMIVTALTMDGTRSSTRTNDAGATVTWTGAIHRTSNDTVRRIFDNGTETARVHTDVAVGNDTTSFTDGSFTRKLAEAIRDSVKSLTFALPRSSNPYPVSGSIVRRVTAHVEITKDGRSATRDISRRIEVLFPADVQGNVVLKIDAKTCQLNLVTRAVTNCQ